VYPTILIADDDIVCRTALERRLASWGHRVAAVSNGEDALQVLQGDHPPPVAILDWVMPGLDGLEVCRRLRLGQGDRYTYVILLSGRGEKADYTAGLSAGVDDYLAKPCDWTQLEARLVVAMRILALQLQLITTREQLAQEASHDHLTGLWNRRAAIASLRRDLSRVERAGDPLSLVLADVDHFKSINDTCGHHAGDQVLVELAARLRGCVRGADSIARWGGEELLLVLPGADEAMAAEAAERVRLAVSGQPFTVDGGQLSVTISQGVSVTHAASADAWETLVQRADQALYRAKTRGRNRVELDLDNDAPLVFPGRLSLNAEPMVRPLVATVC
jgi:diguanylate cyclase (GGDEF)-like protein